MTTPELIADELCQTGENPLWHPFEQRLYWTDIPEGRLFRYDPASGTHEECYRGAPVGGFTIQPDGALLLFMSGGRIARWQAGRLQTIIPEIPAERANRFNDVIADPLGRVLCGTMSEQPESVPGRLYRLEPDGSLHLLLEGIGISNGLGFSLDHRQLYYTDSLRQEIYAFDFDLASGELSNRRVWLHTPPDGGVPDGLTVDAEGCIWSAFWDGSALQRYTPEGQILQRIEFPARKVSSLTFGGADCSDIYVTTALDGGNRASEGAGAGALFRLRLGIRGVPEFFSRLSI